MNVVQKIRDIAASYIPASGFWSAIAEDHFTAVGLVVCHYSDETDRIRLWDRPEDIATALLFIAEAIEQETA